MEKSAVDTETGTVYSEADKTKARTFFKRAEQAAASRNYDYAIELFINGLTCWPEAVEDGHPGARSRA